MLLTSLVTIFSCLRTLSANETAPSCPIFPPLANGIVKIIRNEFGEIATIACNDGYDLEGPPDIYCTTGEWERFSHPQCIKRCTAPYYVKNGALEIEGEKDDNGMFHKGALATYSCAEGYYLSPSESKYRVCEKGIWTGPRAACLPNEKITSCVPPKEIANGYFVPEKGGIFDGYSIGLRLHYSCKPGYTLNGSSVQQCLEDGTWSPKIAPLCSTEITDEADYPCPTAPIVPHSEAEVVQGSQTDVVALPGTVIQIRCLNKYKNHRDPCQPGSIRCVGGRWVGVLPTCVPARDCSPPPSVNFATIYNINPPAFESTLTNKYPLNSQVSYQCYPGYVLQGNQFFVCTLNGCWYPTDPPTCYRTSSSNYLLEVNSINAILISAATGAGVLGLLLVICLITVCRKRKPLSRAVTIAPPVQRPDLGDHASLLHHPDRLALIAFADGMQNDQSSLPTYDEATRERTSGLTANRLHRPHWPNLAGRRTRSTPNPDAVHVIRHGSFASHTPSTRSAGDSMGSTDTMAVSEGSTNITLDTASSHSGSQPASCRVHCGSLASFDTSSVVNTEGVPLLEESELEELQGGDNVSLMMESHSISDNASFKLSNASAELV